jgi:undecaprenyl-diphosphatase
LYAQFDDEIIDSVERSENQMTVNREQCLAGAILISIFLVVLFILVWNGETDNVDLALYKWLLGFNTPYLVSIWKGISVMGSLVVLSGLTLVSIGILAARHDWSAVKLIAIAMGGSVLLNNSIKWLVHRPRPEEIYMQTMPPSFSFPSGHALHSFTFYVVIATIIGRYSTGKTKFGIWFAAVVTVALIGASRVFLGVHYGSDVLGGYLIAALWLMIVVTQCHSTRRNAFSPEMAPHHQKL